MRGGEGDCCVVVIGEGPLPSEAVCSSGPDGWMLSPPTPFAAMHAALGLAAEGDDVGLAALRTISHAHADPTFRDVVAPLCGALQAVVESDFALGAERLERLLPGVGVLGGSAAQREVARGHPCLCPRPLGPGRAGRGRPRPSAQPPPLAARRTPPGRPGRNVLGSRQSAGVALSSPPGRHTGVP